MRTARTGFWDSLAQDFGSGDDEFQGIEVQVGGSFGQMEHFDADDLVGFVVVEDDAGPDLFGFDYGGVVEA